MAEKSRNLLKTKRILAIKENQLNKKILAVNYSDIEIMSAFTTLLNKKDKLLKERREIIDMKSGMISEMKKSIIKMNKLLEKKNNFIDRNDTIVSEMQFKLNEHKRQLGRTDTTNSGTQKLMAEQNKCLIESLGRKIVMLTTSHKISDKLLKKKNETLDRKNKMISEMRIIINEKNDLVNSIKGNAVTDELQKIIDDKNKSLSEMEMKLASKENILCEMKLAVDS